MLEDWMKKVSIDQNICNGKACIKGTKVMISVILDSLAEGMREEEILSEYPSLKKGDIQVAIQYSDWCTSELKEIILKSEFSEQDALELGEKVNQAIFDRFKKLASNS